MSPSISRLRWGEWLAGLGAVALVVAMLGLRWDAGAPSRDGWSALPTLRWLILVTVVAVLAAVVAQALYRGPGAAVALDVVALVLTALTALLVIIDLASTGASLCPGAYVGLAGSLAMVVGVFAALRAEQGWTPGPERPIPVVPSERAGDGPPRGR